MYKRTQETNLVSFVIYCPYHLWVKQNNFSIQILYFVFAFIMYITDKMLPFSLIYIFNFKLSITDVPVIKILFRSSEISVAYCVVNIPFLNKQPFDVQISDLLTVFNPRHYSFLLEVVNKSEPSCECSLPLISAVRIRATRRTTDRVQRPHMRRCSHHCAVLHCV